MVYLVCTYILDTFKPSDLTNKQVWFLPFFIMLMFLWDVICFVSMKVSVLIVMFVAGIDDCSYQCTCMHDTADQLTNKLAV